MISFSDSFQTWTGEVSQEDALARVLYGSTKSKTIEHPLAFVKFGDGFNAEAEAGGGETYFNPADISGNMKVVFEAEIGAGISSENEGVLDFMNNVGKIIADIMDLSGSESGGTCFLNVTSLNRISGPRVVSLTDDGDQVAYYQAEYSIGWN